MRKLHNTTTHVSLFFVLKKKKTQTHTKIRGSQKTQKMRGQKRKIKKKKRKS